MSQVYCVLSGNEDEIRDLANANLPGGFKVDEVDGEFRMSAPVLDDAVDSGKARQIAEDYIEIVRLAKGGVSRIAVEATYTVDDGGGRKGSASATLGIAVTVVNNMFSPMDDRAAKVAEVALRSREFRAALELRYRRKATWQYLSNLLEVIGFLTPDLKSLLALNGENPSWVKHLTFMANKSHIVWIDARHADTWKMTSDEEAAAVKKSMTIQEATARVHALFEKLVDELIVSGCTPTLDGETVRLVDVLLTGGPEQLQRLQIVEPDRPSTETGDGD